MHKPLRPFWFRVACQAAVLLALCSWPCVAAAEDCTVGPLQSAVANGASLSTLPVNLFGRLETGWAFYVPLIGNEIRTDCTAITAGFAGALAAWQAAHNLPSTGLVTAATLDRMKAVWQGRRPFVVDSRQHCPDPPPEETLARALVSESYGGKTILLRPDALAAYRAALGAAKAQGILTLDNRLMTIFSAYRSPAYDDARCAAQKNCQGVVRAACSAHRTGNAMDIYLGAAPGVSPGSSADTNRLYISHSAAYQWLVKNAAKFGLVNYPFEPWHWEFAGKNAPR